MSQGLQTHVKAVKKTSIEKAQEKRLQPEPSRIFAGESSALRRDKGATQRASYGTALNSASLLFQGEIGSRRPPPDVNMLGSREPHAWHDFSLIRAATPPAGLRRTKVALNKPGDEYEQEADRVANQVLEASAPPVMHESRFMIADGIVHEAIPSGEESARADHNKVNADPSLVFYHAESPNIKIQRICRDCEEGEEEPSSKYIQRSSALKEHSLKAGEESEDLSMIDAAALASGGISLPSAVRNFFEPRFNRDLSSVRVHTGPDADERCQSLDSHAFTYGNHVWLSKNMRISPSFVMAHEIAHVVQQTQPSTLTDGVRAGTKAKPRPQLGRSNAIQRLPFWVPMDTRRGDVMSGSAIHKELLSKADGQNRVTIEAPVPNAIRSDHGIGLQGFADLYRASSRVGVYFKPGQGMQVGDKTGNRRHFYPAKTEKAGKNPKPVATATGSIEEIGSGPGDIELGELKPAALTELTKGNSQLNNYEEGFKDAANLTNLWADSRKIKDRWNLKSVKRLPAKAIKPAAEHDPSTTSGSNRELALADIDEVSPKGGKETVKYSVKKLLVPKTYLGQSIPGKLFMEPFGQGLWMYYARPNDFSRALDFPRFKREERQAYMRVAMAVQDEVIGNLKRGPKRITLYRRDRSNAINTRYIKPSPAPVGVYRKPKTSKLKDDFDSKAYERWSKRQSELGDEVRGRGIKGKDTASTFKKLEFLGVASKAEGALSPKASKKTPNFPTIAQLKEQVVTGVGKDKVTKDTSLDKLHSWLERWTSPAYKILGQFRLRFGSVFVAAINKFHEIKESISKKVHEYFEKHPRAKKAGKVLVKALTTALKQVVHIVVPHTLHLVMEAIKTGIQKKLEELFEDSFVEKTIKEFHDWWDSIKSYGEDAVKYIEKVKKDFLEKFDWVEPLINDIKWFWNIVKAGRVLLKCRKPPLLGCLALIKDAANDHELNCVLCIPWVQKQIASFVMAVPWFNNMPVNLGNLILGTLKDAVPDNAKILKDIFSEKIPDEKPDVEDLVPECDADCSGFGFFKVGGGGGAVTQGEAEAAKKLAEFNDKTPKEKIEDLLKEAERRGMLDKPFDQKKAEELLKDLEQKKKEEPSGKEKEEKPAEPKAQEKADQPQAPKQKEKPKPKEEEKPGKGAKEAGKLPKGEAGRGKKPQKGKGDAAGGECVWNPSLTYLTAQILERLGEGGWNTVDFANTEPISFSAQPIKRDCVARLTVKNDFHFFCDRPVKLRKPKITTEIRFNNKELFNQTDDKPWTGVGMAEPKWSSFIKLPDITENGELRIILKLEEPDFGTVKTLDGKVKIEIITKDKCCNCIS